MAKAFVSPSPSFTGQLSLLIPLRTVNREIPGSIPGGREYFCFIFIIISFPFILFPRPSYVFSPSHFCVFLAMQRGSVDFYECKGLLVELGQKPSVSSRAGDCIELLHLLYIYRTYETKTLIHTWEY